MILVDGASTDGTIEIARRLRPDVRVVYQTRRGKGNAMACGFAAARGDIIVTLDADGSADPAEIARFVARPGRRRRLRQGQPRPRTAAAATTSPAARHRQSRARLSRQPPVRQPLHRPLLRLQRLLGGDLPARARPRHRLAAAADGSYLWGDGFEIETLLYLRVAQAGLKVVEVPSYERSRVHGVSNLNAPRDGLRVLRTIFVEVPATGACAASASSQRRATCRRSVAAEPRAREMRSSPAVLPACPTRRPPWRGAR